ncbi:MAG: metallophosphoesterase [Phycisphaerales bacterium]|nr:metallophosphoesterase [Phycisphaerales bacterium]
MSPADKIKREKYRMRQFTGWLFLTWFALAAASPALSAPRQKQSPEVNLVAFGDWGFGTADQQAVADAIAAYAKDRPRFDAALLLGDNFRVTLEDTDDPNFQTVFEKMYDRKRLNFPFYACFGNHDYEKDRFKVELDYARLHPQSRWKVPSRWYRIDMPTTKEPLVTVLMLDSNKPMMTGADWDAQIAWMKQELDKPRARWTVCCAHHTLFSNGAHGDNGVLQSQWGEIFKDHKVDFYLCGHDHTLQHLEIEGWPTTFIVSGGGGARRRSLLRDNRGPYSRSDTGFAALRFTESAATVSLIDSHDKLLHVFERSTDGTIRILATSPSDKATEHPLKVIAGFDEDPKHPATQPAAAPQGKGRTTEGTEATESTKKKF